MKRKQTQAVATDADPGVRPQDVLDDIADELVVIDREHRIMFANAAVRARFQQEGKPLVGTLCYQTLYGRNSPCSEPLPACPLERVLETGNMTTTVHPARVAGSDAYVRVSAYPFRGSSGNIVGVVELRQDITAGKETETELLRRYDELLALSRVSAALSGLWDLDAILKVALDSVLNIMKGTIGGILLVDEQTQMLSYRVHQGLSSRYVEEMRMGLGQGIAGTVAESGRSILLEDISTDSRVAHPDLVSTEGLRAFISVPLRAKDKVLGVINVASRTPHHFTTSDMHLLHSIGDQLGVAVEQAQLYERLRSARERLRQLARQNLVAEEEERRRIARELHDETSQSLSGLALQLQALVDMAEMSGNQDASFIAGLKKVQSLTVQVHTEVSRLITDLRPALLDTLGLVPAVRQHAEARLRPLGIDVSVVTRGQDRRLPPEVEAGLFRWTQGAIGNIAQHSEAKNASIVLEYQGNELVLRVRDDGKGFDVSKVTHIEESGRGRGVFSMKERVRLLGGSCSIESRPGRGTTVTARVPIGWSDDNAEDKGSGGR